MCDRMMNWAIMKCAVGTTPAQIDIQCTPLGYGEATWVTAEGLSVLLTVLNIYFILFYL
jgi:hypothetical protein